ncbi:hypothetical protein [Mycolicibacterium mageritense]|uniref:hypothetical protein n=1 Tax=Mycolicibacterium mageritense TaxID=53462 RepID=UPI001E4EFF23|nr:hypothetical protein [Mycolicibacterium mageritense]GJJ20310.1 hypothetical protein MTY414_39830 [Mycolicibacterium mageritense]
MTYVDRCGRPAVTVPSGMRQEMAHAEVDSAVGLLLGNYYGLAQHFSPLSMSGETTSHPVHPTGCRSEREYLPYRKPTADPL